MHRLVSVSHLNNTVDRNKIRSAPHRTVYLYKTVGFKRAVNINSCS